MFASDEYQLLDFGGGRKLERFGAYVIDRPSPAAASGSRSDPAAWARADARYDRAAGQHGAWTFARQIAETWPIRFGPMTLELKATESGQVGLFPEQAENWEWIAERVRTAGRPLKILNLFAYTGASTLAATAAGAEVTHVDAASNAVTWARRNAALSNMESASIRWIMDDALKFGRRELKRGHHYDAVILDPPSYGHSPKGATWKLDKHLGELLDLCWKLTSASRAFLLLTCHSGDLATARGLLEAASRTAPHLKQEGTIEASDMLLTSREGDQLPSGASVRWASR